jgi:hypothetical protein
MQRSLRRADHSSGGVLLSVSVSLSVIRYNIWPLHYKVYLEVRLRGKKESTMHGCKGVVHPSCASRENSVFTGWAVCACVFCNHASKLQLPQIHDIVHPSHNRWQWECSNLPVGEKDLRPGMTKVCSHGLQEWGSILNTDTYIFCSLHRPDWCCCSPNLLPLE